MKKMPKVGVAVIIIKNGKVLMHKRKNSHGDGTWSLPGGHLEFNESLEECAQRETFEETGMKIKKALYHHIYDCRSRIRRTDCQGTEKMRMLGMARLE